MTTLSPLHERVDAPHRLELPIHPDIVVWRPLTVADAPELAALHLAADAVDHPEWTTPEDEMVSRMSHSQVDLARDSIAAVTQDGAIAAYGLNLIDKEPATVLRVLLDGAIHPDFRERGLGRRLLQWQRDRAQQQLAASDLALPGWILTYQGADNGAGVKLAELLGFRAARFIASLSRDLATPVEVRQADAAVTVLPWDESLSAATLNAHRAAFRDQWGAQPMTAQGWQNETTSQYFRSDLSFLAVAADDPGTVVGYTMVSVFEHDFALQGYTHSYINLVGTLRDWRGKGIATALLSRVLAASKAAGLARVVLDVDTENPTGALGLYEAQGFRPTGGRQVALVLTY